MPIYYVKPDSNNQFPDKDTAPVLEPADGLRAVNIPATSVQYFTRYWWMYAFVSDISQEMKAPANLPILDIDYLTELLDNAYSKIEETQESYEKAIKQTNELASQEADTQAALLELSDAMLNPKQNNTTPSSAAPSSAAPSSAAPSSAEPSSAATN